MAKRNETTLNSQVTEMSRSEEPSELLRELCRAPATERTQLREEWVGSISQTRLLTAMTKRGNFCGSYVGVRQLRGGPRDGNF